MPSRFAVLALAILFGCSTSTGRRGTDARVGGPPGKGDLPWEISGDDGAVHVPDIFYAEAAQNEQLMPLTMADERHQIDRLIYPTLGNPHLFVRDSGRRALMALRIEPDLLAHLEPRLRRVSGGEFRELTLRVGTSDDLAFYLIRRAGRALNTAKNEPILADATNVFKIAPSAIYQHEMTSDMPEAFQKRATLRCYFDSKTLRAVPAGLYDVRVEVKRGSKLLAYEFQYNSLRIFDHLPLSPLAQAGARPASGYRIIHLTDTHVQSGGARKLRQLIHHLNNSADAQVKNAAFVTIAGDLHNGGSASVLGPAGVAKAYNEEARLIVDALKELNFPVFLTPGNHDGFAATGHRPQPEATKSELRRTIEAGGAKDWPGYTWEKYEKFLDGTIEAKGGRPLDLFHGQFIRKAENESWKRAYVPAAARQRNWILYDGFNQWRRTYGPLHTSWTFGENHFISLNTYDLRQHRRSGWGVHTVNQGGGLSPVQSAWLEKTLERAENAGHDIVLLAHHDPRGGRHGKNFPFYFEQLAFNGFGQARPVCRAPAWVTTRDPDCLEDSHQEWMRADDQFDCAAGALTGEGACDREITGPASIRTSGFALLNMIARARLLRTVLLGHSHDNAADILLEGDELVPANLVLDAESGKALAGQDVLSPLRGFTRFLSFRGARAPEYEPDLLSPVGILASNARFAALYNAAAGETFERTLRGARRELAMLRMGGTAGAAGYALLDVYRADDSRGHGLSQINRIRSYLNRGGHFVLSGDLRLMRDRRLGRTDPANGFNQVFRPNRQ